MTKRSQSHIHEGMNKIYKNLLFTIQLDEIRLGEREREKERVEHIEENNKCLVFIFITSRGGPYVCFTMRSLGKTIRKKKKKVYL